MASLSSTEKRALGRVLVIGGCGFLGHHIVDLLIESYISTISVLDVRTTRNRRPESDGVDYYDGDITSMDSLLPIIQKVKPDVVIHTASPTMVGTAAMDNIYYKVNVEGTKCVIEACRNSGVKALVYTSSASVISDNQGDLIHADESYPIIPVKLQTEYYSQTKAEAESLVLAANRTTSSLTKSTLLTVAIRPAGIFGEGDVQMIPALLKVYADGMTGFQLGDNDNMFDFTYVRNVAHGHLLAASALLQTLSLHPTLPLDTERVDGEAFFITNTEPVYFWDFTRAVWAAAGNDKGTEHVWVIRRETGLLIGAILEWGMWLIGRTPKLSRRQVKYSCMTRYYDCGKARRRLGYQPIVGLGEGIVRSVKWFQDQKIQEKSG